ncbi:MAG: hypothetical protein EOP52_12795 [Sphingobacteriales bacterium]|nr:MAG: hypothetical protein EOP52_12795 [Sphingobacteriales bacterium]
MVRKNLGAVAFLLSVFWVGCKSPDTTPAGPPTPSGTGEVLVACEGAFGTGNSALTKLPADTLQPAAEDVFYAANGQQLGDVFQSISGTGTELALCVNNSNRVYFIGSQDYRLHATVAITQPRYVVATGPGRAYVSSLYSNRLFVLDLSSHTVTDTVYMPYKNGESMLLHNGGLYVGGWDTANRSLYRIDPGTARITDSFYLDRRAPQTVLVDKDQNFWVVSGNDQQGVPPALIKLNPGSGQILGIYDFPAGKDVLKPCLNAARDTLYWLSVDYSGGAGQSGVFRMPINSANLPQTPFIASGNLQYFWALGIQPTTGTIYIGDPKGFTQRGEVLLYTPSGTLLKRWKTGVGPGSFFFL